MPPVFVRMTLSIDLGTGVGLARLGGGLCDPDYNIPTLLQRLVTGYKHLTRYINYDRDNA